MGESLVKIDLQFDDDLDVALHQICANTDGEKDSMKIKICSR